jgi:hypothetical protein
VKELSTEEINSVRGGDVNIAVPALNLNEAIAVNAATVVQENIAVLSAGALQSNTADVVQSIRQNVGNIIQRA